LLVKSVTLYIDNPMSPVEIDRPVVILTLEIESIVFAKLHILFFKPLQEFFLFGTMLY